MCADPISLMGIRDIEPRSHCTDLRQTRAHDLSCRAWPAQTDEGSRRSCNMRCYVQVLGAPLCRFGPRLKPMACAIDGLLSQNPVENDVTIRMQKVEYGRRVAHSGNDRDIATWE